jgi:hypothetical protein
MDIWQVLRLIQHALENDRLMAALDLVNDVLEQAPKA